MQSLDTIHDYLSTHSEEIGKRILSSYPALHGADEAPSPLLSRMVRVPYPAQTLAIMGVSKRWLFARNANVVATLRQASRRSWRIGQRRPVEVKFFAYKGAMQEVCLRLMGKKLLVAQAMEGKFTSEGFQAIDGDDDMLTAMARELVENKGIGESADSVWRNVQQLRPSASVSSH